VALEAEFAVLDEGAQRRIRSRHHPLGRRYRVPERGEPHRRLLRHMLNWAVGREYITSTPFKRGFETLFKKFQEDNVRRRRRLRGTGCAAA
jgi:hypothetical protein